MYLGRRAVDLFLFVTVFAVGGFLVSLLAQLIPLAVVVPSLWRFQANGVFLGTVVACLFFAIGVVVIVDPERRWGGVIETTLALVYFITCAMLLRSLSRTPPSSQA